MRKLVSGITACLVVVPFAIWIAFYVRGRRFARRDRLRRADAIVVLAGTRGNMGFLEGKICTAVRLHQRGWAPYIICSGRFSAKVAETLTPISLEELQLAAAQGRIQEKDVAKAAATWDSALGASYIREKALALGVAPGALLMESESLHTRENAEYVLQLLKENNFHRVILVTSPFHQLRTYLTFAKVFQPYTIEIVNYYADTGEWHPATWFLSAEHRKLVKSEMERIKLYREKGDLL
jgi:uncharacterized SAM-binding protein YcdF (DUF218 family)